jgi:multidrug resistance protein MdtO
MVTALNTTGATKQKQLLRLSGATAGGLIAIGALVFVLPELDSITSVTLLVAAVSTISAWFVLASQRLSYFGLQTALAFYLAFIQDYSATTQLSEARDRAVGVLLGLLMMWLVFDSLWPVSAVEHMKARLARNLHLLAELITALDNQDRNSAIRTIRMLREALQRGFATVHQHADSVLFEIGSPYRRQQLLLRDSVLRVQATLRTLFLVEIAICQYRTQVVPGTRPVQVREAQRGFDEALAKRLREIAVAVEQMNSLPKEPVLRKAYEHFDDLLEPWVQTLRDQWLLSRVAGLKALSSEAANLVDGLTQHFSWC